MRQATSADAGEWLLSAPAAWRDLVRYGPPGFEAYVRIAFTAQPDDPEVDGEHLVMRRVLEVLAVHTATPSAGYAAIWEGWTAWTPAPVAPRLEIPHRPMLVFTGPVSVLRDAPALAWFGTARGHFQEPHLVWPEDRAWCLACEADEEIEFTVGCSAAVSEALFDALPGAVRQVGYGDPAPLHRDPA
ncbi:hypothetical protein [Nocardioides sp.]|uniref:hypothetical protein n=1 Tax=Nocardioides sp. TaxID=35761 RepID=UPI0037843351